QRRRDRAGGRGRRPGGPARPLPDRCRAHDRRGRRRGGGAGLVHRPAQRNRPVGGGGRGPPARPAWRGRPAWPAWPERRARPPRAPRPWPAPARPSPRPAAPGRFRHARLAAFGAVVAAVLGFSWGWPGRLVLDGPGVSLYVQLAMDHLQHGGVPYWLPQMWA